MLRMTLSSVQSRRQWITSSSEEIPIPPCSMWLWGHPCSTNAWRHMALEREWRCLPWFPPETGAKLPFSAESQKNVTWSMCPRDGLGTALRSWPFSQRRQINSHDLWEGRPNPKQLFNWMAHEANLSSSWHISGVRSWLRSHWERECTISPRQIIRCDQFAVRKSNTSMSASAREES